METYRHHRPDPAISPDQDPFEAGQRAIARRLLKSVPDLTPRERDFLYDLAREEVRYPMPTVRKICRISRRSANAADREAFAELIRGESLPQAEVNLREAFDHETAATGPADVAQREFERNPTCPTAWQRCKDALHQQVVRSRRALDVVLHLGWKTVA